MGTTVIFIGILIFCAHIFSSLFSKQRIPDVLLLMVLGIVIGPLLHLVSPEQLRGIGDVFSSLTLLLILFDSGVDTSIDSVRRYGSGMVQVTIYSFVLSMVTVASIGRLMGLEWEAGLLLGSMVSGTAAAIVIPMVRQMKVSEKTSTVLSLESAVSGVLCIVLSLAFMESYKMGNLNVGSVAGKVLSSFLMAVVIGVIGGVVWSSVLDRLRQRQHSMFLTPAFVLVVYGLADLLGFSGAIAALAVGVVMGNPSYFEAPVHKLGLRPVRPLQPQEKGFFKELVFIFKTFFFVYIGICIPFTNGMALLYGLLITLALFAVRFGLVEFVGRENTVADRRIVEMMIPKGLVSAVLASMPEQVNLTMGYVVIPGATMIKHITYAVIFCSIVVCSLLVLLTRKQLVKAEVPEFQEEVYDYE